MSVSFHAGMRLSEALVLAEELIAQAGIEEPRREARLALQAATQLSLAALIVKGSALLGENAAAFAQIVARRIAHEPLSRIAGRRAFFGLDFMLSPATLDPRPETEHLVEAAIHALQDHAAPRVLDLGTGTGAILIALAHALPRLTGIGIDIAEEAVATARANAASLGVAERLTFQTGDIFKGIIGLFDAILSNPPYIPGGEIAGLMPEVRLHDPHLALDGGPDGLDFYRRIVAEAPLHLAEAGVLVLEHGAGQATDLRGMLASGGFEAISGIRDYAGIERVLVARPRCRTR